MATSTPRKPNILFIMADDVGWFNIGAYHRGMMAGRTPNLDRLASEGMMFTDYYAEASCTAAQFFIDFPPMQKSASFNLEAVKDQIIQTMKSHYGH